jgi:hypothetical protein
MCPTKEHKPEIKTVAFRKPPDKNSGRNQTIIPNRGKTRKSAKGRISKKNPGISLIFGNPPIYSY